MESCAGNEVMSTADENLDGVGCHDEVTQLALVAVLSKQATGGKSEVLSAVTSLNLRR